MIRREMVRFLWNLLLARARWVILYAAGCTLLTLLVSLLIPPSYQSTVSINLQASEQVATSSISLITSDEILNPLSAATSVPASQLAGMIQVTQGSKPQQLLVTAQATDAQSAALLANTLGTTFVRTQTIKRTVQLQQEMLNLEKQILQESNQLEQAQYTLQTMKNQHISPDQIVAQQALTDTARLRYTTALEQYQQLHLQQLEIANYCSITQPATPASTPVLPNIPLNLAISFSLATLLLLCFFFLKDWLDTTLKTSEDVARSTLVTSFTALPARHFAGKTSALPDALDMVAVQIERARSGTHSLLLTSLLPGAGTTMVACHLARHLARSGLRVLLLESNAQHPDIHRHFSFAHSTSFYEHLSEFFLISEQAHQRQRQWLDQWKSPEQQLWVLSLGQRGNGKALPFQELRHFLEKVLGISRSRSGQPLSRLVDIVLIDAPAVQREDILPLTGLTEETVLLAHAGKHQAEEVERFRLALQRTGNRLLGMIITQQSKEHRLSRPWRQARTVLTPEAVFAQAPTPSRFPEPPLDLETPPDIPMEEQGQSFDVRRFGISLPGLSAQGRQTTSSFGIRAQQLSPEE